MDDQNKTTEVDAAYTKSFNLGYHLNKYRPELANSIKKSLENLSDDKSRAMRDGIRQVELEKLEKHLSKTPNYAHKNLHKDYEDKDKELDKDLE